MVDFVISKNLFDYVMLKRIKLFWLYPVQSKLVKVSNLRINVFLISFNFYHEGKFYVFILTKH